MKRHTSWRRVLLWLSGLLLAAQSLIIGVLAVSSAIRKRRAPPASFPHERRLIAEVEDNEVRVYTYGQDLYNAMLAAIDDARETIFLETFIWKSDPLGALIKQRLERKAAAGVKVFVIYDGFANLVVPPKFKRFAPSVNVLEYRTLERVWYIFDPRRYARDHRKLLVIDHEIAFLGGFNIGKLYATEWRDTHLRIHGPAARDIAHTFADFWNNNREERPALPPILDRPWPSRINLHRNDLARLILPIRGMYLEAIERAQYHIYLTNAYFIPDRVILSALIQAAQRGVDVRVLLPWQSNHPTADWLARGYFGTFLRSGVRIFGFQNAMIHAKTATIDGRWSTVGTANLDRLSLAGNYEINVEIYDQKFAEVMEHIFELDLTNAFELTWEHWSHRPWYEWVGEKLLSPLRPLL